MISKNKWQTYIQKLSAIDAKAAGMIREYIDTNGLENSQELIEYAYGIVTKYGEASAELSCEMYDMMAESQGAVVPPAEPADTATIDEVARGVQWGKYHSPNQIPSIVGRQTRQAGADTMIKNAIRDQVEWAWIPSGDTCAFCITLASRGWQRASKKVLKGDHAEHIHANCDCTFGIAFNEKGKQEYDYIYDPRKYADMYYGTDGRTPNERINSIRRSLYPLTRRERNERRRILYAEKNDLSKYRDPKDRFNMLPDDLIGKSEMTNEILNDYSVRNSRWSGRTVVMAKKDMPNVIGRKEWSCDITLRDDASIKTVIHEHLHARSASYEAPVLYYKWLPIEEGTIELYSQVLCKANGIEYNGSYNQLTKNLRIILNMTKAFPNEYEYAKALFDTPMSKRYDFLESIIRNKVTNSRISEKKKNELFKALETFKEI